jgi:hypothetical protein
MLYQWVGISLSSSTTRVLLMRVTSMFVMGGTGCPAVFDAILDQGSVGGWLNVQVAVGR